jgi:hypothetical protein
MSIAATCPLHPPGDGHQRPSCRHPIRWLDPEISHQVFEMFMDLRVPLREETTEEGFCENMKQLMWASFCQMPLTVFGLISAVHLTSDGPGLSFHVSTGNKFPRDTFSFDLNNLASIHACTYATPPVQTQKT